MNKDHYFLMLGAKYLRDQRTYFMQLLSFTQVLEKVIGTI